MKASSIVNRKKGGLEVFQSLKPKSEFPVAVLSVGVNNDNDKVLVELSVAQAKKLHEWLADYVSDIPVNYKETKKIDAINRNIAQGALFGTFPTKRKY